MTATPKPGPGHAGQHVVVLDGVRGLAIAMVLLYHGWTYAGSDTIGRAVDFVRQIGWAGVDVFFVLSGFLITGILTKSRERQHYWRTFWIRRALRIFPLYYAVLIAIVVASLVLPSLGTGLENIWVNFLYVTNIWIAIKGEDLVPIDIAWSLAIEEQFYLIFPIIVRFSRTRVLEAGLLLVVLLVPVFRYLTWRHGAQPVLGPYVLPYCRMDALALGALLQLAIQRDHAVVGLLRRFMAPLVALALAMLLFTTRKDIEFIVLGYSITAVASAALIAGLVTSPQALALRRIFAIPALTYLGQISYGVYLLHLIARLIIAKLLVAVLPREAIGGTWYCAAQLTGMTLLTVAIAGLSFRYFERPLLRLKDRWAPAS